jgi:hypothetical protein
MNLKVKTMNIDVICHVCNKNHTVILTLQEYDNYYNKGMHIQNAMPDKTPAERELLISGICDYCFNKIFAEE